MVSLGPKTISLQIVWGCAICPLVLLKEDEVTSVENPPPTLPHSCRLNRHPSPALVHLSSPTDNQQTQYVLTQAESLPVQLCHSSLRLQTSRFSGHCSEDLFCVVTTAGRLKSHSPPPQTQGASIFASDKQQDVKLRDIYPRVADTST